jgi:hypothetical protein
MTTLICACAGTVNAAKTPRLMAPARNFSFQFVLTCKVFSLDYSKLDADELSGEEELRRSYFLSNGRTRDSTFFATTALPFAVACVRSACIMPGAPYTSFNRNGSIGTRYFFASS